jgi:hypothetical protein|tara:strand:+ start:20900 stop:21313 length:414 start_codon:yes stop_codon:yes gene_type:complete
MKPSAVLWMVICTSLWACNAWAGPRSDYMLNCQGCHLPDGSGVIGKVPSFADLGDFLTVDGGREFIVRVPGTAQSKLSDANTARVLNWILGNFSASSLPAEFVPYSREEVAVLRSVRLDDVGSERARLIRKIEESGS